MVAANSLLPILCFQVAGAATYTFYFHHGERHLFPWRYVRGVLLLQCLTTAAIKSLEPDNNLFASASQAGKLVGHFLFGLYASLLIFRLFLNPLNKFPGAFMARLTGFHHVFDVGRDFDMFLKLQEKHRKWGDFVRIGPNTLSVAHPDVVRVALGGQSKCSKAPWYSVEHPHYSMHSTRSRADHDARRRIWSGAFSDKALRGYEERVQKYNKALIEQIDSFSGQPIDMSQWFNLWSFDVMGDLAFGKSFSMLQTASTHWAIKLLNDSQDGVGYGLPEWVGRLFLTIPILAEPQLRFVRFCAEQIETRIAIQGKQEQPDITHFLIHDYLKKDEATQKRMLPMLHEDSKLIIVAGSDTSAATLAYLFYHLALEPGMVARLREEIGSLCGADGVIEHRHIQNAPLLNGCIDETLRLHPPVPSGVYRKTPPEGVMIGETYVPGNTVIQLHLYTMARDEKNFVHAEQFIPERFFSKPDLIKNKDAWAPFSIGPYGCIGKNLAYMEIRTLTALLISSFDVALAPGEDGHSLLHSVDHFTIGLKPIKMVLTKRS